MTSTQLYDVLNKAWKSTCKVVLGGEVGELKDFEEWIGEYMPPLSKRKSHLSGKEVILVSPHYCKDARFVSSDEIREIKADPLTINEIKDIDSVIQAISEKWEYTGNKTHGNSLLVESSDIAIDSQYVADSTNITESQYVLSSFMMRNGSKYSFGSGWSAKAEFTIRHIGGFDAKRVFESHLTVNSSDIYLSYNMAGCMDAMFCFSQRNKRHCIGNLELPREKYAALKAKLLAEVRDRLKADKRFPSLMDMAPKDSAKGQLIVEESKEKTSMEPIDKAFSSVFKIMLKKEPEGMDKYEKWLMKSIPPISDIVSPFGRRTFFPDDKAFSCLSKLPKNRTVSFAEVMELGKRKMKESDLVSLDSIAKGLSEIAFFSLELLEGTTTNSIKSPVVYQASNIYRVYDATYTEYAGMGSLNLNSKYTFGCYRIVESQFCLKCHNSLHLNRCFEVDTSSNCLDSLFCHNCEGMSDAMFCFNVKGKRNAIGNTQLEPGRYKAIKDSLIEQIADEIMKNKGLRLDIYNMGCAK
jgi:hypothetical protein